MMQKYATYLSGVLAVGIYITLVTSLIFYFNMHHTQKLKNFVKKNENSIRVSMSSQAEEQKVQNRIVSKKKTSNAVKKKIKHTKKIETKKKPIVSNKKIVKKKVVKKKKVIIKKKPTKKKPKKKPVVKKKVVKKHKSTKKDKTSKIKQKKRPKSTKDLFAKIKTTKKKTEHKKIVHRKSTKKRKIRDLFSTIKTEKKSDKGTKNIYFAEVKERLMSWPAQSEYAGEKATVWLKIKPNGDFIFKVLTGSSRRDFNEGLIAYLEQLKQFGFGAHKGSRAYELNVEFVATE